MPTGADSITVSFCSNDGIWVYVNGSFIGHWGGNCHTDGCTNGPTCAQGCNNNLTVPEWNISNSVSPGTNVISVHISNGSSQGGCNFHVTSYGGITGCGNHALRFDGIDEYVNVQDAPSIRLTGNYTVEAWIWPTSFGYYDGIVSKYQTAGANGYTLRLGNFPYTSIQFNGVETATGLLSAFKWYHIAGVVNGNTVYIYINGVLVKTGSQGYTTIANSDPLRIGVDYGSRYFSGVIDEVRLWNTPLSQSTIAAWMNKSVSSSHPNYSNLAGYWKLDEGIGPSAADSSGGGNTGFLTNGPIWVSSTAPIDCQSVLGSIDIVIQDDFRKNGNKSLSSAPSSRDLWLDSLLLKINRSIANETLKCNVKFGDESQNETSIVLDSAYRIGEESGITTYTIPNLHWKIPNSYTSKVSGNLSIVGSTMGGTAVANGIKHVVYTFAPFGYDTNNYSFYNNITLERKRIKLLLQQYWHPGLYDWLKFRLAAFLKSYFFIARKVTGVCYGMASSSIAYKENPSLIPEGMPYAYKLARDPQVDYNLFRYHITQVFNGWADRLNYHDYGTYQQQISNLRVLLSAGSTALLGVYLGDPLNQSHAVVAHGLLDYNQKGKDVSQIFAYDNRYPDPPHCYGEHFATYRKPLSGQDEFKVYNDKGGADWVSPYSLVDRPTAPIIPVVAGKSQARGFPASILDTVMNGWYASMIQESKDSSTSWLAIVDSAYVGDTSSSSVQCADNFGRKIVFLPDSVVNEIPGADAIDAVYIRSFRLWSNVRYTVTTSAQVAGEFSIIGLIKNNTSIRRIEFPTIVVRPNDIAYLTLDPDSSRYTVRIDRDGNSTIDTIVTTKANVPECNTVSNTLQSNWNLVALPVQRDNNSKKSLYPSAISIAYAYNGAYIIQDSLDYGVGYWLKFPSSSVSQLFGATILDDSVSVKQGWNIIGSISYPVTVASITSNPPGIITSRFFGYGGNYTPSSTIEPGKAYWVKVNQDGKLVLSVTDSNSLFSRIKIVPTSEVPPAPPTDLKNENPGWKTPKEFVLEQNYPNPFNPSTIIRYSLPVDARVTLRIYNLLGQEVSRLIDDLQHAGTYEVEWAGAQKFGSGIYYYRLQAGVFVDTKKLVLVR